MCTRAFLFLLYLPLFWVLCAFLSFACFHCSSPLLSGLSFLLSFPLSLSLSLSVSLTLSLSLSLSLSSRPLPFPCFLWFFVLRLISPCPSYQSRFYGMLLDVACRAGASCSPCPLFPARVCLQTEMMKKQPHQQKH